MLEVRLLGRFDVKLNSQSVVIPSRPAQSLLAYLILNAGTAYRREQLAGLLWPDTSDDNARSNLRHALWRIRKAIESKQTYLVTDDLSIQFDPDSPYQLDVRAIERDLGEDVSAEGLIDALAQYHGELLPGFYDEWITLERERLQAIFERKMELLLDRLIVAQRWSETLDWGERWIALGQSPEPAYRAMMQAHSAMGNIPKVAATFERCVDALRNDLNVEPSEQTRELYRKLLKEQSAAAASITVTSSNKRTSNIPIPLTSFIGRERQIEEVKALLTKSRLVTLTGAGGSGKTRLAVQVATDLVNTFEDGVRWVELAAVKDASLVPLAVAKVLDVREGPNQLLSETLVHDLRSKQLLLVLDNCEQVIAACAQLADMLLHSCPNLRILTTSVEKLRISGETVRLVPSLSVPRSENITSLEEVNQSEAARLFIERATAILPTFSLNLQQAALVVKICQHLSGIPLAIELAAARVNMLSLEEIVKRLGDRFRLLVDGGRITIAKHQTLRATMDWSYDLLGEQERILFQRLSVFAGGLSLDAAEAVCSGEKLNRLDILNLVGHLVDKSLVSVDTQANSQNGQTRYRLQETIRAYAHEKLDESGETERLRQQHRDYFIAFAEEAEPKLKSAEQFDWLDRLEVEHDNLRAAWECAIDSDADFALRLASALLDFWSMRGNPGEGRLWLALLIDRTNQWGSTAKRAHALGVAGRLAYLQRDFTSSRSLLEAALAIARKAGDQKEIAYVLLWLGWTAHRQRDDQTAEALAEECLTIYQQLQNRWGMAMAIYVLAGVLASQGQYAEADERYMNSLVTFREIGDKFRAGYVLNGLGELARLQGDYVRAGKFYEEHIEILRQQRSSVALVTASVNEAWVSLYLGDYPKARALFEESLKLSSEYSNKIAMMDCLAGFASVFGMSGKPEQAARLFGGVEALLERSGMRGSMDPVDQKEIDHYVAHVRSQLDETEFKRAWSLGQALTLDQAIEFALSGQTE